jgi:3-deoxy-manno-octulosonate cytidylyltransferase (CMP-KDO synthetase)
VVVIPARFASTRLPGKPLLDIAGKPLIQHVYERGLASAAREVIIATDDARIQQAANGFGATVCMTSSAHQSGTDRIAEVIEQRGYSSDQIIVNLQGDEPLIPLALLHQVAGNLHNHPQASIATLCERIESAHDLFNPNVVKVVMDRNGYAMYFSRAPIPWEREGGMDWGGGNRTMNTSHFRHIGLYAYRVGFLHEYTTWSTCELEQTEALEQLRAMWQGHKIHVDEASEPSVIGVDTEEDLQKARAIIIERGGLNQAQRNDV